jgi:Ca-activated chloride channel homolog
MKKLILIMMSLSVLFSQDMGIKMYNNGDIESALNYYQQLSKLNDEELSKEEIMYNIGTIFLQMDSTAVANSVFEEVFKDSLSYSSDLSYNYGNTLYKSQKLQESLEAYREALLKNPNDVDARKNYEFVKNEIDKNKSMQKKQDNDSEKSDEDENNKNKEKEKDRDKKDQSQDDKTSNKEDKNDSKNNDKGPKDNQNSKSPDQQNNEKKEVQSKQSAENILNAIKENEKVNKKRKQTNYNNESGKDW